MGWLVFCLLTSAEPRVVAPTTLVYRRKVLLPALVILAVLLPASAKTPESTPWSAPPPTCMAPVPPPCPPSTQMCPTIVNGSERKPDCKWSCIFLIRQLLDQDYVWNPILCNFV